VTPLDNPIVAARQTRSAWRRRVAVESLEAQGQLAHRGGHTGRAVELFEEALRIAGDDVTLAARASLGLASRHIREGNEDQALMLLDVALSKATASGDRILIGRILNNIGIVHFGARRYLEALERFRASLDVRQGLGYRRGMVTNLHNIGDTHLRLGEAARAWAAFVQSRTIATEIGWEAGAVMNEPFLAYIEALRVLADHTPTGRPSAAIFLARLERSAADAERLEDTETAVSARRLLGELLGRLGEVDAARDTLHEALRLARAMDARPLVKDVTEALDALGS